MNLKSFIQSYVNTHVYLLFRKGHPFLNRFLKEGFTHIDIVTTTPPANNFALFIPTGSRLLYFNLDVNGFMHVLDNDIYSNILEIELNTDDNTGWHFSFPHILSCTLFAKCMLGIDNKLIITPYQLYKYILRKYNKPTDNIVNVYKLR